MAKIVIDPITRIEGHLKIEATVDGGTVKEARSSGTLFRGFELILRGRDPRDASVLTQRICGVCPIAHASASSLCLDDAFGIADRIPKNGRVIRNLILGANYIQSHILHFYHLAALDYVDVTAAADYAGNDPDLKSVSEFIARGALGPFVPRYEGDYRLPKDVNVAAVKHYVMALEMRRKAQEMLAIFGGKMPHQCAIVAGGVTERPTVDKIAAFLWRLNELREFIDNVYVPDVLAVAGCYSDHFAMAKGCGRFLSYGAFDLEDGNTDQTTRKRLLSQGVTDTSLKVQGLDVSKITEDIKHSWFEGDDGLHPSSGKTDPNPRKKDGYSFLKSPRYGGEAVEVGPLARMLVSYASGDEAVKGLVDGALSTLGADATALFSILGRHAARALECKHVADSMVAWLLDLDPAAPVCAEYEIPKEGEGFGISGAPRGAVGHWIKIENSKVANYQCIVPTTWNASPRDGKTQPGPIEQALEGLPVKDEANPFEVVRTVRAFDPCIACAVHVFRPSGAKVGEFSVL
jgi:hydrogenase large subunit